MTNLVTLFFSKILESQKIQKDDRILLILDENNTDFPNFNQNIDQLTIITNQFSIAETLRKQSIKLNVECSDFDLSKLNNHSIDLVIFRISKIKAINQHILNQVQRVLKEKGIFCLIGKNQEGVQSLIKNSINVLGKLFTQSLEGKGIRIAHIKKESPILNNINLQDDYLQIQNINQINPKYFKETFELLSKDISIPNIRTKQGIYGFNKVDEGSFFLIQTIAYEIKKQPTFFQSFSNPLEILDLGCGYGYLSISLDYLLKHLNTIQKTDFSWHITATDDNITAVETCQINFNQNKIQGHVVLDDCAQSMTQQFDLIICNPPFHQGFKTDLNLSIKFIQTIEKTLKFKGIALVVINNFLQFQSIAKENPQLTCKIIAENTRFSALLLTQKS